MVASLPSIESLVARLETRAGAEAAEWARLSPAERWEESAKLWVTYLSLGGQVDTEPGSERPRNATRLPGAAPDDGRAGVHSIWGGGV